MSEPTKEYLDGYARGIQHGRVQLVEMLIAAIEDSKDDDYGYKKTLLRWVRDIKKQLGDKR